MKHGKLHERDGRFTTRVGIPKELRPFIAGGATELRFPHGSDPRAAKRNHPRVLADMLDQLDRAREAKARAEGVTAVKALRARSPMSDDQLARDHYRTRLAMDDEFRNDPRYASGGIDDHFVNVLRDAVAGKASDEELQSIIGDAFRRYQHQGNVDASPGSTEWRRIARVLASAEYEAVARVAERDEGDFAGRPTMPALLQDEPDPLVTPVLTFTEIIDAEVKRRTAGKNAKGVVPRTIEKFRRECRLFAEHRKSDNAVTVTKAEAVAWIEHVQTNGTWSNSTLAKALMNIKTVLGWGRKHHSEVMPEIDPLARVEPPQWEEVPSYMRTYTVEEARTILRASLTERLSHRRWVPWLCAYSGARISEIASLRPEDFLEVEGKWFYVLTTTGGRRKKTVSSIRRVPLHQTIVEQGFLDFVKSSQAGKPIFSNGVQQRMGEWIRDDLGIRREHLAPSHGWRHLFEDLCTVAGVSDDARAYITGRAKGTSRDRYGRSDAALPGLAREISKIEDLLARK